MYVPVFNTMPDAEIDAFVEAVGAAELITVGADGYPTSTLLPVLRDGDRLVFHMARANPHWRSIAPASPALAVVTGPQAYVSAAWYPSKREHGRVVPTWNYSAVHVTGTVTVYDDQDWVRDAVTRLTRRHEERRPEPWQVSDAPATYIDGQLRAVVGLELRIEHIEAKAKLSQNRTAQDHAGVVAGLLGESAEGADRCSTSGAVGSATDSTRDELQAEDGRAAAVAAAMIRTGVRKRERRPSR